MASKAVIQKFFSEVASEALVAAIDMSIRQARDVEHRSLHLAHVVLKLLETPDLIKIVPGAIASRCTDAIIGQLRALPRSEAGVAFELTAMLEPARLLSEKWAGANKVSPLAFLATCLNTSIPLDEESQRTRELLRVAGLTIETLMPTVADQEDVRRRDFRFELLGFGTDITAKAAAGFWPKCPLVGMNNELRKTIKVLNAKADSVVLTGEPGVGKSALVEGLAYKIVHGDDRIIPQSMRSWTIVLIEASDIIKSAGVLGGLEREMKKLLDFFRANPTVIPFFDEVHRLLDATDENLRPIATALKPPMANGSFTCIGATTNREYTQFIVGDDAMRTRLRRVQLVEPTNAEAVTIIEGSADRLLEGRPCELGVAFSRGAIESAIHITTTYKRTERLPRKAINLLKIAASEKAYDLDMKMCDAASGEISDKDVARIFSELEEIPVDALASDQTAYYRLLAERLGQRVIGQKDAINAVTGWLTLHSKGWVDPQRPRGRFVFTGPSGVGKTELAKALARELMRDPEAIIVLDMGEFQDEMATAKFMGASAGYVGFGDTQTIYSRVMSRPYSVILLDEFEKCHPALSNPMLSILDGFATDARGQRVDFSQTIIIMTSNAVAGGPMDPAAPALTDEAVRELLPHTGSIWTEPLLDRIDKICSFSRLDEEALATILHGLIQTREANSVQPLPAEIHESMAKLSILKAAARQDGSASARRLERAMLDWLRNTAEAQIDDSALRADSLS